MASGSLSLSSSLTGEAVREVREVGEVLGEKDRIFSGLRWTW